MASTSSQAIQALRTSASSPSVRNPLTTTRHGSTQSNSQISTLSLDSVLSAANGDPMVALETLLTERNNLHQQNAQLWKLMEKSRAGYANSLKDLDRIRSERDKALAKLDTLVASDLSDPARTPKSSRPRFNPPSISQHPSDPRGTSLEISNQSSTLRPLINRHISDQHEHVPTRQSSAPLPPTQSIQLSHPSQPSPPQSFPKMSQRFDVENKSDDAALGSATSTLMLNGDNHDARPTFLSRESRISLPDEAARYITDMPPSPLPSPSGHNLTTSSAADASQESSQLDKSSGGLNSTDDSAGILSPPSPSGLLSTSSATVSSQSMTSVINEEVHPGFETASPIMETGYVTPLDDLDIGTSVGDSSSTADHDSSGSQETPDNDSNNFVPVGSHESQPQIDAITPTALDTPVLSHLRHLSPRDPLSQPPSDDTNQSVLDSLGYTTPTYRAARLAAIDLPFTIIKVQGSNIRTNDRGKEVLSFVFSVQPASDRTGSATTTSSTLGSSRRESWMVEKLYSEILALDSSVRSKLGKGGGKRLPPLPEGKLFKDHAPAKVDQRKAILETYIQALASGSFKSKDDISMFLSTDIVRGSSKSGIMHSGHKEGYLTKRGKNFGGWKTRYFVLQSPVLEYYESRGGQHLGSISITGAQIGRQQKSTSSREADDDNSYRHAFLIIEAKRGPGGASIRHVLCAESDEDRDSWVEVLVRYVVGGAPKPSLEEYYEQTEEDAPQSDAMQIHSGRTLLGYPPQHGLSSIGSTFDDTAASTEMHHPVSVERTMAATPFADRLIARRVQDKPEHSLDISSSNSVPLALHHISGLPTPSTRVELGGYSDSKSTQSILPSVTVSSQPKSTTRMSYHSNASVPKQQMAPVILSDRAPSPEKTTHHDATLKAKLISGPINGAPIPAGHKFGTKDTLAPEGSLADRDRKAKSGRFWGFGRANPPTNAIFGGPQIGTASRAVFGVPLEISLSVAQIADLPAVVFRCIEYLEGKNAEQEEGVYRLSGSSNVIKGLKDRFNLEGDVDLLRSEDYWDPHAITGLLKTFLRDLPVSILTRELHLKFLGVIDLAYPQERLDELTSLISQLPLPNYSLLRALTAHLILIVQNANINKMTMRNVGIVFSPTLGIPAGVFSLMLGEFEKVFNINEDVREALPLTTDVGLESLNNRNSKSYADGAADRLLGLSGRKLKATDEESDENDDLSLLESSDTETENEGFETAPDGEPELSSSNHHSATVAAQRGLQVTIAEPDGKQVAGLPASPRPPRFTPI